MLQSPAVAATPEAGYLDGGYAGNGLDEITSYHSQNKLWYNAGTWWSVMWNDTTSKWTIHKLVDPGTSEQAWSDTEVEVDARDKSHYDAVADGDRVYISASNDAAAPGDPLDPTKDEIRTFTYEYKPVLGKYEAVNTGDLPLAVGISYASIAKAGTKLWLGYASDNQVFTASSTNEGDTWSDPVPLDIDAEHSPIIGPPPSSEQHDDVAVMTAIPGGVGAMWSVTSDTGDANGGFMFAANLNGAWSEPEAVWFGESIGDNHVSVKMASDGRLIAVVKTSLDKGGTLDDPLIAILERSASGEWTVPESSITTTDGNHEVLGRNVSTVRQDATRPTIVLNEGASSADVYYISKVDGGDVWRRVAPLSTLSFSDPGSTIALPGQVVIHNSSNTTINNPTSSKHALPSGSGVVVLASDKNTHMYLHSCIGGPCEVTDPSASFTANPAALSVTFANTSTGTSPTWEFGDGTTGSGSPVTHTYSAAGSYSATMTATFPAGQRQATQVVSVAQTATSTALTSSPNPSTSGQNVTMTATVTNSSGTAVPQGSVVFLDDNVALTSPILLNAGVATFSTNGLALGTHHLTAAYSPLSGSEFAGSTSSVVDQVVQATPPPPPPPPPGAPVAAFTADRTDGRAPLDVQFTDASTGGPTSWSWEFGDGTTSTEQSPLHTYVSSGTYTAKLTVSNANGSTSATTAIVVSPSGNRFMPVTPTRVLTGKQLGPNSFTTITLKTPPGSNAVALNVTATKVTRGTMIAVCANDQTAADCVTHGAVRAYKKGSTAGFTISELDPNDAIKIFNSRGTATVNIDVQGWYVGRPLQTTYYTGLAPAKRLVTAKAVGHKMLKLAIPAALRPAGTVAVALNITAANPTANTKIAVCGKGQSRSECRRAPALFSSGSRTVTNYAIARLRAGGTVKLLNTKGTTRLTVDIEGSFSTLDAAALYRPNPQRRLVDARGMTPKTAFTFTQRSLPPGTTAVVLRVTVSSPTTNGSLSVCQGGTRNKVCKATSVLAVQRHRTTTNVVVVQVGTGGTIKFYNAKGKNKLTVDAIGSFGRN